MNTLSVAAWNVKGGFASEETTPALLEEMKETDADVWILSEAFDKDGEFVASDDLEAMGYKAITVDRDEADYRSHRMVVALSRIDALQGVVNLGRRSAVSMHFSRLGLTLIGAHFDDQNEKGRLDSVDTLIEHADLTTPFVLVGDLNSMHSQDPKAKLFGSRVVKPIAERIPHKRLRHIATRLNEMADGTTMQRLGEAGLVDADPQYQATLTPYGIPTAQLDHVLYTPAEINIDNFDVGNRVSSDHRPITAILEL